LRQNFDRLIRDLTLTTFALAIAGGWALFQVASGLANTITVLLNHFPPDELRSSSSYFGVLAWRVGGRILTLGDLVKGLIELAVVVAVALWIRSRQDHAGDAAPSNVG
jgi:hypothetical protein